MNSDEMKELQKKLDAKRQARDIVKAGKLGALAAARDKEEAWLRRLASRRTAV